MTHATHSTNLFIQHSRFPYTKYDKNETISSNGTSRPSTARISSSKRRIYTKNRAAPLYHHSTYADLDQKFAPLVYTSFPRTSQLITQCQWNCDQCIPLGLFGCSIFFGRSWGIKKCVEKCETLEFFGGILWGFSLNAYSQNKIKIKFSIHGHWKKRGLLYQIWQIPEMSYTLCWNAIILCHPILLGSVDNL